MKNNNININLNQPSKEKESKETKVSYIVNSIKSVTNTIADAKFARIVKVYFVMFFFLATALGGLFAYKFMSDKDAMHEASISLMRSQKEENIRDFIVTPKIQNDLKLLTYTLNAHVDTPVILDDQGSFAKIDETKPRRVQDVKINNEPIDPEKIYTVAGSKYILQQAGDGMTMFKDCKAVLMSGLVDNDTVLKYVEEYLNGVIPKEGYDKVHGQGRITILE